MSYSIWASDTDWKAVAARTLTKIPVQWHHSFYYWVAGEMGYADHIELYAHDQDVAVREFLGPTFDLIRLPVGV